MPCNIVDRYNFLGEYITNPENKGSSVHGLAADTTKIDTRVPLQFFMTKIEEHVTCVDTFLGEQINFARIPLS